MVRAAVTDPDSTVIGAPVRIADGTIVAVLSIAGPSFRLREPVIAGHGEAVQSAAAALATLLGRK